MSLVLSPELREYCLVNQAASEPPTVSEAVTAVVPLPPSEVDKVTHLMENASIGVGSQANSRSSDKDELPGSRLSDEGDSFETHLGTHLGNPQGAP